MGAGSGWFGPVRGRLDHCWSYSPDQPHKTVFHDHHRNPVVAGVDDNHVVVVVEIADWMIRNDSRNNDYCTIYPCCDRNYRTDCHIHFDPHSDVAAAAQLLAVVVVAAEVGRWILMIDFLHH